MIYCCYGIFYFLYSITSRIVLSNEIIRQSFCVEKKFSFKYGMLKVELFF